MPLRFLFVLAFFSIHFLTLAQDVIFSQLYNNHLYLNPALTGREIHPNLGLQYRNQWPNLSFNFITPSVQFDQKVEQLNSGIGFYVLHDFTGNNSSTSTTNIALNYAYHLELPGEFELSAGIRTALGMKLVNFDALAYGDMIDPREGLLYLTGDQIVGSRVLYPDVAAGISLTGKGLFLGASGNHLNRPNVSFTQSAHRMRTGYSFYGGYNIRIPFSNESDKHVLTITPHANYHIFSPFSTYTAGVYMNLFNFTFAANYSKGKYYTGLWGYDFNFGRVAYSYVYSDQELTFNPGGIHEVSLNWRLGVGKNTTIQRHAEIPQF